MFILRDIVVDDEMLGGSVLVEVCVEKEISANLKGCWIFGVRFYVAAVFARPKGSHM